MNLRALKRNIPFAATAVVTLALYVVAAIQFRGSGFFSVRVFVDFFSDNAFLGIAAVGMTFVILTGGIDLSVGGLIGFVSIGLAVLIEKHHFHPVAAIFLALLFGAGFGAAMGCLIQFFSLPPFLVTLGGMFLARGLGLVLQQESISIDRYSDLMTQLSFHWRLPGQFQFDFENYVFVLKNSGGFHLQLPLTALIYLGIFLVALLIAHWTKFGRNVYALGGNEQSSTLMGLPVARTKIGVYAVSGFCSALAGVVYTVYMLSGNASAAGGLELDAIAAVVIGGTLLSGGVGYLAGTFLGVLIFAIIQTAINFQGKLNSWWTRIVIGMLLLGFILLQKLLQSKRLRR